MIILRKVDEIIKEFMEEYYKEVLLKRSISDPRDGFKPVQRKILWSMHNEGFNSKKPYMKCARVVGDVIAKWNPHGDSSAYEALTNLASEWKYNLNPIDFHGNKGSQDGDSPAAYRYTEARTHVMAEKYLLSNLNDKVVDFVNNFDNTEVEPIVLPSRIPLILINGSYGIGGGYMASIPQCNPIETFDHIINYLKTGEYEVLMPDYPTGGVITNAEEVRKILSGKGKNGSNGSIKLRAKVELDRDKNIIKIVEAPFQVSIESLKESIADNCKDKKVKGKKIERKIDGVKNFNDLSNKGELDIRIEVKKGFDIDTVLNQLYKYTKMERTVTIQMVGCKDEEVFIKFDNQKEIVDEFIKFRRETIKRVKHNNITLTKKKMILLEGQYKVLVKNLDLYLKIVRNSTGKKDAFEKVKNEFDLNDDQTENILNTPTYKLNKIDINEIKNEIAEKKKLIEEEIEYIRNPEKINEFLINELIEIKNDFKGYKRKTELTEVNTEDIIDTIPEQQFDFTVSEMNFIKKIKHEDKTQKRGGKGQMLGNYKQGDSPRFTFTADSRDILYIFTSKGKLFTINCYDMPETNNKNRLGVLMDQFIDIDKDEKIITIIPISREESMDDNIKLSFVTKKNKIKLVNLSSYKRTFNVMATRLMDDDELLSVEKINMTEHPSVFCCLSNGYGMNIDLDTISTMEKSAYGSMVFDKSVFSEGIEIVSVNIINKDTTHICFLTRNALIKRTIVEEFPQQKRGGKGRICCKLKDGDILLKSISVSGEEGNVKITSNKKVINTTISGIPISLRPTYGSACKHMEEDEEIIDMIIV